MSASLLPFEAYADGIQDAAVVLHAQAVRAGLEAAVPTCPGWTVRELLAHQGMVHRWATATVLGERVDTDALEQEGLRAPDVVDWLDDGVEALLRALDRAPADLDVWFFLADPPPARIGWSRRQCHETTVHGVDAIAAALGRPAGPDEVWFGPALAVDGVDELLTGFLPRPGRFPFPEPRRVLVTADDVDAAWTLDLGPDGATTARGLPDDDADAPTTVVHAPAVALYLGLWNRLPAGDAALVEEGDPFLEIWRRDVTVTW